MEMLVEILANRRIDRDLNIIEMARTTFQWDDEVAADTNMLLLLSSCSSWVETHSNLHLKEVDQLNIIFSVMPLHWARHFMHGLVGAKNYDRNRARYAKSPLTTLDLTDLKVAELFLKNKEAIEDLLMAEMQYLVATHGDALKEKDVLRFHTMRDGMPDRNRNVDMLHLFPVRQQKKKAEETPKKVLRAETAASSSKKPRYESASKQTEKSKKPKHAGLCWNCQSDSHTAKECVIQCRRCPIDVKKPEGLHLFFDCPKREKPKQKPNEVTK
jgi:hypothetical protein